MGKRLKPWGKWSPTKLDLLLFNCPLNFYFEYVAGMRNKVRQSLPKIFGEAIHHMLERFFGLKYGYKSLEKFIKAWIYYWLEYTLIVKYGNKIRIKNPDDPQRYLATGISILKNFYSENLRYRTGKLPMPQVEQSFNLKFKGHRISGKIDRIQPVNSGVEIWDYKTGWKKPSEQELIRDVQFTFYNFAWLKKTGRNPVRMRLDHLFSGEQNCSFKDRK